jgi:hypothetical protein
MWASDMLCITYCTWQTHGDPELSTTAGTVSSSHRPLSTMLPQKISTFSNVRIIGARLLD